MTSTIHIQRAAEDERNLPVFSEIARRMDAVRQRAFELFAERGGEGGHELDDWVAAEHQVFGWPAAEFKDVDGAFEVDVTLPGFDAQEVEVTATPSELIVHAATTEEKHGEDAAILWSEFGSNDVYRHVGFPRPVAADRVTATLENGLLKVRAPK
ncbi:MAG TPA: Hsp20/alpha crystallin family protein, partial [Gemmatimonadaceae bacterium]|nr:Hsp20/alpha crystallin family protein [Gemmatimonadaceae bacterium]